MNVVGRLERREFQNDAANRHDQPRDAIPDGKADGIFLHDSSCRQKPDPRQPVKKEGEDRPQQTQAAEKNQKWRNHPAGSRRERQASREERHRPRKRGQYPRRENGLPRKIRPAGV